MDISMNNKHTEKGFRNLIILYGSQTGTAQDVAENIAMQSRGSHFRATAMELDSYSIQNLVEEELVLFICSTTGQGEPPDNMKKFWRFILRKSLPNDSLQKLKYGVLGLGDSSYTKYNFVAKKLDRRIQQLGGHKLVDLGLADDQHEWGADATVDPWVTKVWENLLEIYPLPNGMLNPSKGLLPPPRFEIVHDESIVNMKRDLNNDNDTYSRKNPFYATVFQNKRVTPVDHFQETIHLCLNISDAQDKMKYNPGDVVMIKPSNTKENVHRFLETFPQFESSKFININLADEYGTLPQFMKNVTTLEQLATDYFDFMSVPRRSFFQILQHFANDETEKEKLVEFASPEGTDERYSYANRPRRNILEIFQDFHKTTTKISLIRLLEIIPEIQPRAFSIASSPTKHKNEIHVLVAVVKYKTMMHIPREGLCSTWLSKLSPGSKIPVWIKTGGIRFPSLVMNKDSEKSVNNHPCIMIGPGTGVAPFRSAIYEHTCKGLKDNILFFGCRNRKADFYFEEEWKKLVKGEHLKIYTAFSRDQEDKIYVQHKIAQQGKSLWDFIKKRSATVYVAGNSKNMPDSVRDAFLKIFQDLGEMTEDEAVNFYETLQRDKRYQQETWS